MTLAVSGTLGDGVSCSVRTGSALAEAGLHPASGGDGALLCSGDMLLEALVACAGVTLQAVATSLGVPVASGTVRAEGELDFRGTLAVDRAAPVGFRAIRLRFELDTVASEEQLAALLKLTERYCVVLRRSPNRHSSRRACAPPDHRPSPARRDVAQVGGQRLADQLAQEPRERLRLVRRRRSTSEYVGGEGRSSGR